MQNKAHEWEAVAQWLTAEARAAVNALANRAAGLSIAPTSVQAAKTDHFLD
jgi:hypothetical protein